MIAEGDITRCVGDAICLVVAETEDILNKAKEKGEAPFIFLLDDIRMIPIIWELLSVLPTLQAHMVLSFRKDMRQGLHQQLQKLLQGL